MDLIMEVRKSSVNRGDIKVISLQLSKCLAVGFEQKPTFQLSPALTVSVFQMYNKIQQQRHHKH